MHFQVVDKINFNRNLPKIGAFWYDKETRSIYHDSPWPWPVQLALLDGLKKCIVTPRFLKTWFILKGWVNHDILMREIDLLRLVEQDMILMHASCVDNTLIVGFPQAGKTYQTYKMVSEGGTLISEEYTIIHGKTAMPYKPIMRSCFSLKTIKDCKLSMNWIEWLTLFKNTIRAKILPFMHEAVIWKSLPVTGKTREIKKIVYGSTGEEIKNWKTFAILCENEFPFMAQEILQAYAVASGLDLIEIQNKQRNLIKQFVESVYA